MSNQEAGKFNYDGPGIVGYNSCAKCHTKVDINGLDLDNREHFEADGGCAGFAQADVDTSAYDEWEKSGCYLSEDIREHLKQLEPENVEALAKEIEKDSIRKRSLEESNLAWPHRELLLQRHDLSSDQLKYLLKFTESFHLNLQIKRGCERLVVQISEPAF